MSVERKVYIRVILHDALVASFRRVIEQELACAMDQALHEASKSIHNITGRD